jgi:hypothetical protein
MALNRVFGAVQRLENAKKKGKVSEAIAELEGWCLNE